MPNDNAVDVDEHIDIDLRPVAAVAARGIIIASLIGLLARTTDDDDPATLVFDLREWLRAERLWDKCTEREQAVFTHPDISLDDPAGIDLESLAEQLTTLGWALSLADPFSGASEFSLAGLINAIPGPWDKTSPWIAARELRPEPLIAIERERAEIWHWRLEIESYRRVASGQDLDEIEQAISEVTSDGMAAGLLAPGGNGGFTLDGTPLSAANLPAIASLEAAMRERLRTLNWVCGFGTTWDDVPLEI